MQSSETPKANPSTGVVVAAGPSVAWRVVAVEPLAGMRLRVRFVDGTTGEVDLARFLASPQVDGTLFEPLRDVTAFRQVDVQLGAVVWSNGADLAPDSMYDAIQSAGRWVVGE